jgi:hypothetical protein
VGATVLADALTALASRGGAEAERADPERRPAADDLSGRPKEAHVGRMIVSANVTLNGVLDQLEG